MLAKTNRDMRVVREEIFGPVLCVQSFDDEDLDAVARFANDTEYGLQASIWTQNLSLAHRMARKIKAGTICINTHNYGDPAWPLRWLQTIRLGPRDGQRSDGALYGNEIGCRKIVSAARVPQSHYSRNSTMVAPAPPSCCGAG